MPIHDQSYRRYAGPRSEPGAAWLVIAAAGVRSLLGRKLFLAVMLAAWGQFFVRAVMFYLSANFPTMNVLAPSVETFRQFLDMQEIFVLFVTVYVGSGLIANDRRSNALQIYLSKPLSRAEYVAGKLAILAFFLLMVTLVPALALLMLEAMFSASLAFLLDHLFLLPAITLYALTEVSLASFTMLALSSLSTSARYTAMLYAGALFFTAAVSGILRGVTAGSTLAWLSLRANVEQIGDVIFRLPPRFESPWPLSVLVVLVLIGLSALVLDRRVRGVEVVT